ncbi:MAG: HAMP domain-containing protein [Chitinophagaceae bacterium]|nr:MAG: HAMP domain-containing protein [Chitinophagaceae bacterium]
MKLSTQILLAFGIVIVISVTDSYTNYQLSLKVQRNTNYVATSETIIRNSTTLHKSIIEMQSGFRGYLLTGDSNYLVPFKERLDVIAPLFDQQKALLAGTPKQLARLDSIEQIHLKWLDYSFGLMAARKDMLLRNDASMYNRLIETQFKKQVGMKLNNEIGKIFRDFDRYEYGIRQIRRDQLIKSIENTHTASLVFLVLVIIVGSVSTYYIMALISRRISLMVTMAKNISKGEFTVLPDKANDELTGLSTSLNVMSDTLSKNIAQLEKTNAELNQFAHVVSHDLKAPVRGIYHVIQWIEEDLGTSITPELQNYLNIISQRTRRMEDLINGLLEYARLRHNTHIELVDSEEVVREICDSIVPRDFEITLNNLPELYAQKIKLQQVFANLISNAVKYSNPGKGKIEVSCVAMQHEYLFSVKDDGIGIDGEYHDKIFEIFQTLREKDQQESTGIGLAIVKKILVDQHCKITVTSSGGQGSIFTFSWPKLKSSI